MFGLFNKDKKERKKEQDTPEFIALVKKWDDFLAKIEARFNESLVNAEEAILDNLDASNYDIGPTLQAWRGIKSQLMDLGDKVDSTFDDKVLPQMLELKKHYDLLDEKGKGTHLRENIIYKKLRRFEIVIEGKVSTQFYNHAVKFLNKDFKCTQCSAKLEVRQDVFHSHYVSCDYCNTVNTFTPNDKITQIRWVVDNIARYNAIEEWDTMKKAKNDFRDLRPPDDDQDKAEYIAGYKKREDTERAFWIKYFLNRSEFLPQYKETIEFDVGVKMEWFYEERKRELNF